MGKTINIYLNTKDREEIEKLKVKYNLSLTTITDILIFESLIILKKESNKGLFDKFRKEYILSKGQKTSIKKPRILKQLEINDTEINKLCTNVLTIYIRKELKHYFTNEKELNRFYSNVDRKMNETYEEFWDYNYFVRKQRRMLRENKEYFKKAIETVWNH